MVPEKRKGPFNMTATNHSLKRAKERANLNEVSAKKMMENAYLKGMNANDFPAKERNYMINKCKQNTEPVYYNGFLFIFNEASAVCVTLFHAPGWFMKKTNFDGKKQIRNPKRYFTKYSSDIAYGDFSECVFA